MTTENAKLRRQVEELINRLCDDLLSEEELVLLDELLHDHEWARECYLVRIQLHARLQWCSGYPSLDDISPLEDDRVVDSALLGSTCARQAVHDSEKLANKRVQFGWLPLRRLRDWGLAYGWVVAACLLVATFFVVYRPNLFDTESVAPIVLNVPSSLASIPVQATLTRTANVEWGTANLQPELGSQPGTQLMRVIAGRIQMTFDNGVEVVVEGSAEFSHDGFGSMTLSYGTLTAVVPSRVAQFSVYTSSAFVDCRSDSEFGLVVKENGQSELHVLRGAASAEMLRDREVLVLERTPHIIQRGQAVRIDRESGLVSQIACDIKRFNRISVQCLDVVDLLSGGNGYGDHLIYGISALTGLKVSPHEVPRGFLPSDGEYHPVSWNPYVDGVFVPRPTKVTIQIDSRGHACDSFPAVSGETWVSGIMLHRTGHEQPRSLGPYTDGAEGVVNWLQSRSPEELTGITGAFLGLHANCGITLDLRKIEEIIPEGQVHNFHAELLHIKPTLPVSGLPVARPPVLWVFLDGELYASYRPSAPSKPIDIDITVAPGKQFMTLVATDGDGKIAEDWMVLANPILKWLAISPTVL